MVPPYHATFPQELRYDINDLLEGKFYITCVGIKILDKFNVFEERCKNKKEEIKRKNSNQGLSPEFSILLLFLLLASRQV